MIRQTINIDDIVYSNFVKYDTLDYLIHYAFAGSKSNMLNIYIDLYGLYHQIISRNYITNVKDQIELTSLIVNMCAHYRSYFKFLGVYTKFYIISSYNIPKFNTSIIEEYNKTMKQKLQMKNIVEMISLNEELLSTIVPYLPDIFFIKTNYESSVMIHHIINTEGKDIPALIISKDIYPMQLCTINNNVSMIWPRKHYGEDTSLIICPKTHPEHKLSFWSVFELKQWKSASYQNIRTLSTSNFALLLALNKLAERDIKCIFNISKAGNMLYEILGDREIKFAPDILFDTLGDNVDQCLRDIVNARYKTIDIEYQYLLFSEDIESKVLKFENLNDPTAIQIINDKYFKNNPIDIYRL